ncbi:MAG: hypothetical protein AAF982_01420 [Pseudomonadota bacterium]
MVKRGFWALTGAVALSACAPAVPDSGRGVGLDNYHAYLAASTREEPRFGGTTAPRPHEAGPWTGPPPPLPADTGIAAAAVDGSDGADKVGIISDEQDFDAVIARESIESDRERLARQRAQYQVVEPTTVPRNDSPGPNIVQYALSTSHQPGTRLYSRARLFVFTSHSRSCASYGSPDIAQEAFLADGGPERDRRNLDPDGDGFACGWNPIPFRTAVRR